jgi:type I restriction enzyme R subunit
MSDFTESVVEEAARAWLESLGYAIKHGPDISPGGDTLTLSLSQWERESYSEVILSTRLREALMRLNPTLPNEAIDDAFRKITRLEGAALEARNRAFHRLLVDGVTVEYRSDGGIRGAQAQLIDFDNLEDNDWLAVNQFTVVENKHNRRPDIVLFVNGLPLGVIELKNAADEDATIWDAYQQLQTYQAEIQTLFAYSETLVISDGVQARIGSLGATQTVLEQVELLGWEVAA